MQLSGTCAFSSMKQLLNATNIRPFLEVFLGIAIYIDCVTQYLFFVY